MIVPLIQPAVTSASAKLFIKMNVGLETTFGAGDSDPSFVISDGSRFIGMLTLDKNNYKTFAPCLGIGSQRTNYESPPYRCLSTQTI